MTDRALSAVAAFTILGGVVLLVGVAMGAPAVQPDQGLGEEPASIRIAEIEPTVQVGDTLNQLPQLASRDLNRIDFLEVRSTGNGEYAYRMRVRGFVQRATVNDRLKAEHNDVVRRNADGTWTVVGTTGNGQSDAFTYAGQVIAFEKIRGESGGQLSLNGLEVSRDDLLNATILEVVSTDEDLEIRYRVRLRGSVERISTSDDVGAGDNDRITRNNDGSTTIDGVTGNEQGDAYRIRGRIIDFRKTGGDSDFVVHTNGIQVNPDTLLPDGADPQPDDDDRVRQIDECTTITSPGQYQLITDIRDTDVDTCIEINASDVVLDGGNHRLIGEDTQGSIGIAVRSGGEAGASNVTVRNLAVADWGTGIWAGTRNAEISDLTISDITSRSNREDGLHILEVEQSDIDEVNTRNNGGDGVSIADYGRNMHATDLTAEDNGGFGIIFFDGSTGPVVRDAEIAGNGLAGIKTSNSDVDLLVVDSVVVENDGAGIDLDDSSSPTVRNSRLRANGGAGLDAEDVNGLTVRRVLITENDGAGVSLESVRRTGIVSNVIRDNSDSGVTLRRVGDSRIVSNVICGNGEPQIRQGERVEQTTIADNTLTCNSGS